MPRVSVPTPPDEQPPARSRWTLWRVLKRFVRIARPASFEALSVDRVDGSSRDVRWEPRTRRTVVIAVAALAILVLWGARDILGPFVWAGIFAYVMNPGVNFLCQVVGAPRPLAVLLLYVIGVGTIVAAGFLIIPELLDELTQVTDDLPDIIGRVEASIPTEVLGQPIDAQGLSDSFNGATVGFLTDTSAAIDAFRGAFRSAIHVVLALVAGVYLLLAGPRTFDNLLALVPHAQRRDATELMAAVNRVLGGFIRGELILVGIMSVTTFIGLSVIGLPFALVLALATGFLELIPVFGPIIAALAPIGLALVSSNNFGWPGWLAATVVAVMYTLLRQIEDYLVIPNVVGRVVRVQPLVALFAIFAGLQIWGVTGMVIALPVAGVARVLLSYAYRRTVVG
jgi:predicted PurR-regulated permease PerM